LDQNRLIPYGAKDAHFEHAAREGLPLGRVICQERLLYTVISKEGEILLAVTGRFRQSAAHPGEYPVAGDWVLFSERGIEKVLPRSGFLARVAAGNDPYRQPVAANMDVLFVCMPADSTYNRLKLERFLAAAAGSGARPVLLITKADLCADIGGLLPTRARSRRARTSSRAPPPGRTASTARGRTSAPASRQRSSARAGRANPRS